MKTILSILLLIESSGAEQAKMLVMAMASVVIILIFTYRNKNKKDE